MPRDIERELDEIFTHHKARVAEARGVTAARTAAAAEDFSQAAAACLADVIIPALQQMAEALRQRGVAARVLSDGHEARIDIPVSRHARLGVGHGGYPYVRARPDRHSRRIHFERNTTDGRGGNALGDCAIAEVSADSVKALVLELVRELYGPF
jgi:hypothetical protein